MCAYFKIFLWLPSRGITVFLALFLSLFSEECNRYFSSISLFRVSPVVFVVP
jgi:hypothetical protein